MSYSRFGPEAAQAWVDAAVRPRTRWVTLWIGVAAVVSSIVGTPAVSCLPSSPCGGTDIDWFGVFAGLFGLSLLGLWLWPEAGALLGVVVSLIDVAYDPSTPGRIVFTAFGVACVWLGVALRRARRRQFEVMAHVPGVPVPAGSAAVIASGRRLWSPQLWLGAGAAVAVAVLALWQFSSAKEADRAHRERAIEVTGVVTSGTNGDGRQQVSLTQGALSRDLWVTGSGELPRGLEIRFRVDPTDTTWTELPFDAADHSMWLTLAILMAGSAGAVARLVAGRRAAGSTVESVAIAGVELEAAVSRDGDVLLRPQAGGGPVARLRSGPLQVGLGSGRRGHSDWIPAVVVGELRDGGWVQVRTAHGTITPGTPLRLVREADVRGASASVDGRGRMRPGSGRVEANEGRMDLLGRLLWIALSLTMAGSFAVTVPDAVAVAQGHGVPGMVVITREDCAKSCTYTGDYQSNDGRFSFPDVSFTGSGEVGSRQPGVYVGSGERPDEVYTPGPGDLWTAAGIILFGLGMAGWQLALLLRRPSLWRPQRGR